MVDGMEQTLRKRAAIVTGAGRGIGEVIALTLAHMGGLNRRPRVHGAVIAAGETRGGEQSKRCQSDYRGRR